LGGIGIIIVAVLGVFWRYRAIAVDIKINSNPVQKKHQLLLPRLSKTRVIIDEFSDISIVVSRGTGRNFSVTAGSNSTLEQNDNGYTVASLDNADNTFFVQVFRSFGGEVSTLEDDDGF
jgi:hypothetical protein